MNIKRILIWVTKGWNSFFLFIASLLALWATLHFPSLWVRGAGLCLVFAASFVLIESLPGGELDPERHHRKSREKKEGSDDK